MPKLWIAAVSQIVEGTVMESAVVDQTNTELDLTGLACADIVMRGGGSGAAATGNVFELEKMCGPFALSREADRRREAAGDRTNPFARRK